jgi:hypothetical protein
MAAKKPARMKTRKTTTRAKATRKTTTQSARKAPRKPMDWPTGAMGEF